MNGIYSQSLKMIPQDCEIPVVDGWEETIKLQKLKEKSEKLEAEEKARGDTWGSGGVLKYAYFLVIAD